MSTNASLGNGFVPKIPSTMTLKILNQISVESLINLCLLWASLPQTQPSPSREQIERLEITEEQLQRDFLVYSTDLKGRGSRNKRNLIDKLLVDFYRGGLNLLQLAQLDMQLLIEKPLIFYWQSNSILNSDDQEQVINIHEPQVFLNHLVNHLSQFYLNHIYISRHPHYPLIIIRIQLFDLISDITTAELRKMTTSNSIVSRKPFFMALPLNSSNLITSYHSPSNVLTSSIVIQSIESALSHTLGRQIRIDSKPCSEQPIRSLESLHIIKGNSRFAESMGVWIPYADGTVDISPFDDVKTHTTFKKKPEFSNQEELRAKIAALRFKGSLEPLKAKKLYVDVKNNHDDKERAKKRKLSDESGEERNVDRSEFSSITPIQYIKFEVQNEFKKFRPNVKFKFHGNDVFGGLHELCVDGIINPETIPGWLTGEDGLNSGMVRDDVFQQYNNPVTRNSNDLI